MIILLKDNEINNLAAQALNKIAKHTGMSHTKYTYPFNPFKQFTLSKNNQCFIIDIGENNLFQSLLNPEQFGIELINAKFPKTITDIYLVASEDTSHNSLIKFAHHLAKFLSKKAETEIFVHTVSEINYIQTNVSIALGGWTICGMRDGKKELLWEGQDILQWLSHPQRTFTGKNFKF